VSRPRALLWLAVGAFALGFSSLGVLRHRAFSTGRFDLGNMVQAVWSTAHGHPLQVTDLGGEQVSRLGIHFDPILVAFAPLWWVWPHPSLLLVVQAAAVALGAVPVFRLGARHTASERLALGLALAYLLAPPTQWLALNEFHPVALATPLLLLGFDYLDQDRLLAFAVVAAAACTTKEEIPLVVAAMGLWYAFVRRRWRPGLVTAGAGVVAAVLILSVVMPHAAPGGRSPFAARYDAVGGSPGGIARTAVTHPGRIARATGSGDDGRYLVDMLLPYGFLSLLSPPALLTALPELAANTLSATRTQTSIRFHYTAGAIPGIAVAAVLGAAWLVRRRPGPAAWLPVALVVFAVLVNVRLGPIPLWREIPGGQAFGADESTVTPHARVAARAVALVPGGAVVSATNSLGAHLSARRRILSFPRLGDATWVAADETRPGYLDRVAPLATATALRSLRADPRWRLVFEEDGVLVFRRR